MVFFSLVVTKTQAQTDSIFADVSWNGQPEGRDLIILRDGAVLVKQTDALRLGISVPDADCERDFDGSFVDLSRLRPRLSYTFDERELTLKITSDPSALPHRTISVADQPEREKSESTKGIVLIYDAHASPGSALSGSLTQRVSVSPNKVFENTIGRTAAGMVARGSTALTIDAARQMRRTIVGDSTLSGGILANAIAIGGISVSRNFSLDPYQPTYPMPAVQTTVTSPSLADVYVNGILIKTLTLAPGNYDLSDIPIQAGYSNARVVLRNEFGTRSSDIVEYGAPALLRRGLTDYQYGLGRQRTDVAGKVLYGPPAFSALYRTGISSYSTVGATLQLLPGELNAGMSYAGVSHFGYVQAEAAASDVASQRGSAFAFVYSTSGLHSAASFQARFQSPSYRSVGSAAYYETLSNDYTVTETQRLGDATTASLSARYAKYLQSGTVRDMTFSLVRRLNDWNASANLVVGKAVGSAVRRTNDFTITLTRSIGISTTQSITAGGQTSATIARSADSALGSSYNATFYPAGRQVASATSHIGLPFAAANVSVNAGRSGPIGLSADVGGSVVLSQGRIVLSQPIDDAYALVHVDATPNAAVYLNGRYAARTNSAGYAVVPFVAANQNSHIAISSDALPLDDVVGENDRTVSPSFHSGTPVHFAVHRLHAIFGIVRLRHNGSTRIPAFGDFHLQTSAAAASMSPVDETGRFYLDDIAAGTFTVTISDASATCEMQLRVPQFVQAAHDMGTLECAY